MKLKHLLWALLSLTVMGSCTQKKEFLIGVSQCSEDSWRETVNTEMLQEAAIHGDMEVIIKSVKDDSQQQVADVEDLIKRKVDLLVISPNESSSLTPITSKAFAAGIPVILFDRKTNNNQYTAYVGGDNFQIGQMAADYITSKYPDARNIVLMRGTEGSTADEERYEGFMSRSVRMPDLKIVAERYANFNKNNSRVIMRSILDSMDGAQNIDIVFAFNDRMGEGISEAYAEYYPGLEVPVIIGVDASTGPDGTLGLISDHTITASLVYPTGGSKVIDIARKILLNEPYERENALNTAVVDQDNVRLFQLQANQILEKQAKVSELNSMISTSMTNSTRQRIMLYILLLLIMTAVAFLAFFIRSNRKSKLMNLQLNDQNIRIKEQVEELEAQKQSLQELSQSLEETTQAKLMFYTNISHEFKTPLALISGPINDLMERRDLDEDSRKKVDILFRNSNKLNRLITELLDFRTYENGKVSVNYSMGDIKGFVDSISSMFADVIQRRGISFEFIAKEQDYNIPFDPVKMEKMFTNLMSNAFNHVNRDGQIKVMMGISEEEDGRKLKLSVFNSGSFIPESEREKIFLRFYSMTADQKGTGIGLALTTSIVEALGGRISVDSDEKSGTTFTVVLPIMDSLCTDAVINQKSYSADFAKVKLGTISDEEEDSDLITDLESCSKPTLLVIEDNSDMRMYLRTVLGKDYHVITANDGDDGIMKALKQVPSLILCDIMMPGKDGFEVCTELRSHEVTERVPIILLTACSLDDQIAKGYECGADSYLQKPFSVRTLKVRIAKLMEKDKKIRAAINGDWLIGRDSSTLSSEANSLLTKIKSYVEEHIYDEISIEALVKHVGCSKSKFYRDIKEITDYSTVDIVNMIRLKKAVELMINEHKNISDAAFNSGFSSPSYFSRTFFKYYNERPKDYIKRITAGK